MKKTISLLLALTMLFCLFAGCRKAGTLPAAAAPRPDGPAETGAVPPAETDPVLPADEPTGETGKPDTPPAGSVHPMLYHVTGDDGQEMYLFGTIHIGDSRTEQALELLQPTLDGCDALAVEFDLVAYEQDYEAQLSAMYTFLLTDGTTVEDHMPADLYAQASALLEEAGLMPDLMKQYNLAMWSQLVQQAAMLTRSSLDLQMGMDRLLINYCHRAGIEVRDVESAEFQYELLASFSDELNLLEIRGILNHLDEYGEQTDELFAAWCRGDSDEIQAMTEDESAADEYTAAELLLLADYSRKMITERNTGMCDKAKQWLEAGDKVFFAVGAGHLVGPFGIVNLLKRAGYSVEQISVGG